MTWKEDLIIEKLNPFIQLEELSYCTNSPIRSKIDDVEP